MVWKPTVLAPVSRVSYFTSEWKQSNAEAEFSNKTQTDKMDLDNHLLASTTCGLICDFNGASNFINDKPDTSQVTLTCNWTQKLWVERHKNMQNLVDQNIAKCKGNTQTKSEATHVVVSVLYGAQIFCVFAQDVKGKEEDEQVRKETQEKLAKIMKRFQDAFHSQLNLENFKQEFNEEKHELVDLKCRLYMDLKAEPVNECNLFDAYQYCIDLKRQIYRDGTIDISKLKGVPIAIQLCPLEVLLPTSTTGGLKRFNGFRDVDKDLINRSCRILANLKRVVSRAEKMFAIVNTEANCLALRDFVYLVSKYQHFLQEDLKKAIVFARNKGGYTEDRDIIRIVNKAENYLPHFKISQLEQWIDLKEAEMDMMELIVSKVGARVLVFADASQLKEHFNKKNALVLTVPPLDERTNETLVAMKKCCAENFEPEQATSNVSKPWYLVLSKKKLVLNYLKELDIHLQRNNEEPIQVIVTFGKSSNPFGCSYSVYENGILINKGRLLV